MKLEIRIEAQLGDEDKERNCLDAIVEAVKGGYKDYLTGSPPGSFVEVNSTWPERRGEG